MPPVARMEKMTVMGIATVTSCSKGTPSYGVRPPGMLGRSEFFFYFGGGGGGNFFPKLKNVHEKV